MIINNRWKQVKENYLSSHSKLQRLTNFSHAIDTGSQCFRPDKEGELLNLIDNLHHQFLTVKKTSRKFLLARGNGLSYGDCCVNDAGIIIDTSRLNHLLSFDESTATVSCQGGARFSDLFLVHSQYIPPVIPGTLHATIAGGVANDIHGKNNHVLGTLGQHIVWLELHTGNRVYHCSLEEHTDLFKATLAGLGLTGIILRVGLKLRKASRFVTVQTEKYTQWKTLLLRMQQAASQQDYQVAWLDLLTPPNALLFFANHTDNPCDENDKITPSRSIIIPPLPMRLITKWGMRLFNRYYYQRAPLTSYIQPLCQFNNPLDFIKHWTRLYGKHGLLQFQGIFDVDIALNILNQLHTIIQTHQATPTLAVLKYFNQSGNGLLSFAQPGFTIAIDFINKPQARAAIKDMNELLTKAQGKIYLAKDLFLTPKQFAYQYQNRQQFIDTLACYPKIFRSDIAHRLELV